MKAEDIGKIKTPRTNAVILEYHQSNVRGTVSLRNHARRQEQAIAALMEALQDAKHDIADAGWYSICDRYEGTLAAVREHLGS